MHSEYGDLEGKAVILFHGSPGSRLFRHPDESIALNLGIRLITVDRPGYGLSDFKPDRTYIEWADDVARLADWSQFTPPLAFVNTCSQRPEICD